MNSQPARTGICGRTAWARLIVAAIACVPMLSHAADPKRSSPEDLVRKHLTGAVGVSTEGGFDPAFLKLDRENQKLFEGIDVLDEDPVCQCQDTGGKYRVTGKGDGVERYIARVSNTESGTTWQVILRKIGDAWKIYDVIDDGGSVRGLLERHNACARDKLAHHQVVDACASIK